MPRPQSENTFQVAFKIPEKWLEMADEIAAAISRPGVTLTRTDAMRAALARGLEDTLREVRQPRNEKELPDAIVDRVALFEESTGSDAMPKVAIEDWIDKLKLPGVQFVWKGAIDRLVREKRLFRVVGGFATGASKTKR